MRLTREELVARSKGQGTRDKGQGTRDKGQGTSKVYYVRCTDLEVLALRRYEGLFELPCPGAYGLEDVTDKRRVIMDGLDQH